MDINARLISAVVGILAFIAVTGPLGACAQGIETPTPVVEGAPYTPAQLDQLLAPIALYPDPLLTQILTASTYPLEVVEAARWLQNPGNAALKGDALAAALQTQDWDPSVKSLVPFPQILKMMDSRLDWMQKLGDAFLTQQADVMDSVQRLRREAQAAGTLATTPQQVVTTKEETIVVESASPEVVYVPVYDCAVAYGVWPYPAYPPLCFPLPEYYVGPGIFFGVGFFIFEPLWGWEVCDWHRHRVHVDYHRYNDINRYHIDHDHRPRLTGDMWEHDPYHRRGVAYPNLKTREQFQPGRAQQPVAGHQFRGFEPPRAPREARAPAHAPAIVRPSAPVFEGFGTPRSDVRVHEERGRESRGSTAPSMMPRGGAPHGGGAPRGSRPHGGAPAGGPTARPGGMKR